jgi:serine/threonine protein phosphatase PrpC
MLTVCSRTNPGILRPSNEDATLWDPSLALLAVADGMGGHNAGEVASRMALDAIRAFLQEEATNDLTWPFGFKPALSVAANRLMTAIKIANLNVFSASEQRAEHAGMGTTVVAALVEGSRLTFASVGDSRIYSLSGNELRQLTKDDSWVVMLMKESGLEASAFAQHPMRHVLTSVVGARPGLEVLVQEIDLVDGQMIMLCTDGLHGALSDDAIRTMLQAEPDVERAADTLVETAVTRDGKDNITVVLARYTSS